MNEFSQVVGYHREAAIHLPDKENQARASQHRRPRPGLCKGSTKAERKELHDTAGWIATVNLAYPFCARDRPLRAGYHLDVSPLFAQSSSRVGQAGHHKHRYDGHHDGIDEQPDDARCRRQHKLE